MGSQPAQTSPVPGRPGSCSWPGSGASPAESGCGCCSPPRARGSGRWWRRPAGRRSGPEPAALSSSPCPQPPGTSPWTPPPHPPTGPPVSSQSRPYNICSTDWIWMRFSSHGGHRVLVEGVWSPIALSIQGSAMTVDKVIQSDRTITGQTHTCIDQVIDFSFSRE